LGDDIKHDDATEDCVADLATDSSDSIMTMAQTFIRRLTRGIAQSVF
jgi:hypothetical protein